MQFNNVKMTSNLLTDVQFKIKTTKNKLKEFIKYKNENKIKFNDEMTEHLKILIELWNNNKNANIEYYFNMKEHHSFINCQIEDVELKQLWEDYIDLGLDLRTNLMFLNDICLV